jgi:hypothetical protein
VLERVRVTQGRDGLSVAAVAFLVANLLHGADHVRQDFAGITAVIFVGGLVVTAAAVTVALLSLRHHPRAPLAATVVGLTAAALVASSHAVPHWSVLSDSYIDDIHPDALAWVVMVLEVGAGFVLGVVGARRVRGFPRAG